MDSPPSWAPKLPPSTAYIAGAPHGPSNALPDRQIAAPRP